MVSKKHLFYLSHAKGFRGRRKSCYKIARQAVEKSWEHAFIARKVKKRLAKKSWITNLNAAVREQGQNYSQFINGLKVSNILINRKMLAELAVHEPYSFKSIVDETLMRTIEKKQMDKAKRIEISSLHDALEVKLKQTKKILEKKKN